MFARICNSVRITRARLNGRTVLPVGTVVWFWDEERTTGFKRIAEVNGVRVEDRSGYKHNPIWESVMGGYSAVVWDLMDTHERLRAPRVAADSYGIRLDYAPDGFTDCPVDGAKPLYRMEVLDRPFVY